MLNNKRRVILVPIDDTEQTKVALKQSYRLARSTKSTIILLSVDNGQEGDVIQQLDTLVKEAEAITNQKVKKIIVKGNLYDITRIAAGRFNPICIYLGVKTKTDTSLASRKVRKLINKSGCPVLSIGSETFKGDCKHILLPLDLTLLSREKVKRTVILAKIFGAEIQIISAVSSASLLEKAKIKKYANQCREYILEHDIEASFQYLHGKHIPSMVLDYAKKVNTDLIVLIESDGNFSDIFNGSTVNQIISRSEIPVLSLTPIERKETLSKLF
jgi:nucleotide-binding universal stress UspA family protein